MPALIAAAGEDATRHFLNFFIASIRNRNTRRSYARQARLFLSWCEQGGLRDFRDIRTEHVAAYVEMMTRSTLEPATVKQALSSLRMLFDWLVVHQVFGQNPTDAVRGPKLSVTEGKTPNLPAEEVAALIESISTESLKMNRFLTAGLVWRRRRGLDWAMGGLRWEGFGGEAAG